MNKIVSPWAAVAAFFIICAMVTAIVLSGHASALTVATTAVGGLVLAGIRVVRGNIPAPAPIDDAPTAPKPPSVPPIVGVLFMLAFAFVAACGNSPGAQEPNAEGAKCVAHRTAKQLECADLYATKAEIDACRDKVKAEIECVDAGAKDGGIQ